MKQANFDGMEGRRTRKADTTERAALDVAPWFCFWERVANSSKTSPLTFSASRGLNESQSERINLNQAVWRPKSDALHVHQYSRHWQSCGVTRFISGFCCFLRKQKRVMTFNVLDTVSTEAAARRVQWRCLKTNRSMTRPTALDCKGFPDIASCHDLPQQTVKFSTSHWVARIDRLA